MDSTNKFISQEIDSGRYFSEAREWYKYVFVKPASDAAFMIVVSSIVLIVLTISLSSIYSIYPMIQKVKIVVFLEDTINFYPNLKRISDQNKTVKQAVIEYLCSKYVKSKEGYDKKKFKANYNFILRSSAKNIFANYYQKLTEENEDDTDYSIAKLNKIGGKINIEIISTSFDKKNNRVTVKFHKKIYNKVGKALSDLILEAQIKYYISDYDFTKSTNTKLKFIVTQYELKQIK